MRAASGHLSREVLFELSAKSTPKSVQAEVQKLIEAGEVVTAAALQVSRRLQVYCSMHQKLERFRGQFGTFFIRCPQTAEWKAQSYGLSTLRVPSLRSALRVTARGAALADTVFFDFEYQKIRSHAWRYVPSARRA